MTLTLRNKIKPVLSEEKNVETCAILFKGRKTRRHCQKREQQNEKLPQTCKQTNKQTRRQNKQTSKQTKQDSNANLEESAMVPFSIGAMKLTSFPWISYLCVRKHAHHTVHVIRSDNQSRTARNYKCKSFSLHVHLRLQCAFYSKLIQYMSVRPTSRNWISKNAGLAKVFLSPLKNFVKKTPTV